MNRIIKRGYGPITDEIEAALMEFASHEAYYQAGVLRRAGITSALGIPSDADLHAAMYSRPFQGKLLREWLSGMSDGTARRVREAIRQGYVDGLSALEIASEIRGARNRKGIWSMSRRGAETMVRTAVAHTANAARERTYRANPEIEAEQWVSVLDTRTSAICRARDGEIFPVGKGPRPPAHPNCRSTMVALTRDNRKRVIGRMTYQQWLEKQPAHVQDDILGKAKGRLFRAGEGVDRFVDKSGQEYTLAQLRAKDAETWRDVFGE